VKISVKGAEWSIALFSDEVYRVEHPDCLDSAGVTVRDIRLIHFNKKHFSRKVVIHELLHAHMVECCVSSADLDTDAYEEVVAVMLEDSIFNIVNLSDQIFKELACSL